MAVNVVFNGTTYSVPTTGDMSWGSQVTALLQDIGANALTAAGGGQTISNKTFAANAGSASAPAYSFISDPDSGLYSPAAGQLSLAVNGADRVVVDGNGNLTLSTGTFITTGDCYVGRSGTTAVLGSNTGAAVLVSNSQTRLAVNTDGTITFGSGVSLAAPTINSATLNSPAINSPAINGGTMSNVAITGGTITGASIATSPIFSTAITVGGAGVQYSALTGHTVGYGWNGANLLAYVDSTYVGPVALGTYVPSTGGGFSGGISAPSFTVATSGGYLAADANYSYYVQDGSNWQLRYQRNSGRLSYVRGYDGAELFVVAPNGDISCPGQMYASGNISSPGIVAGGSLISSAAISAATQIYAGGGMWMGPGGTGNAIMMGGGGQWYWDWNSGNGNLLWQTNTGTFFVMRTSDRFIYNNQGNIGGNAFQTTSDARLKEDIKAADHGLDHILGITPQTFRRKNRQMKDGIPMPTSNQVELGFVAQDVQKALPEAVTDLQIDDQETLAVNTTCILAAAVNAIKTLTARVKELEAKK